MTVLYGINNCATVKKARRWLDEHGVAYRFHDFRADGIDDKHLACWTKQLGWETLLNHRGTTWRGLPEAQRDKVNDAASAVAAMLANPALIKRPVLEINGGVHVGFSADDYATLLNYAETP
jgi:Spx/MgsR family transcriptional regulator